MTTAITNTNKNGEIISYRNMEQMQQRTGIIMRQIAQIQQRNKQPIVENEKQKHHQQRS